MSMKITHIYHSAFLITMENSVLLFDWYKKDLPDIPKDKKLYVFCSHSHGDHYSAGIWDLQKTHPDILYVMDEGITDAKAHREAEILTVRPREEYLLPGMRILTLESTDMGVAFYIETEGKRIYHAGDLNVWFWNDEPMEDNIASEKKCREEMQYLASKIASESSAGENDTGSDGPEGETKELLDAAFVPLDFRLEEHAPRCIAAFMEILGAKYVFPMHYWGRGTEVREYLKDARISQYTDRIFFDDEKTI